MTEKIQSDTKKVAILIEQNVEDVEFQIPYNALPKAGAEVTVLGSRMNEKYVGPPFQRRDDVKTLQPTQLSAATNLPSQTALTIEHSWSCKKKSLMS